MKHFFSFFARKDYSNQEIVAMLQSGDNKQVRAAENYLFDEFRKLLNYKPFIEILKDSHHREEAYSDAHLDLVNNVKARKFEEESSLKTYFNSIFFNTCVMYARKNATNKSKPVKPNKTMPSEELLKDMPDGVQGKLRGLMSQQFSSLWDETLTQFRLSNYRCYYVLSLRDDLKFPYEAIVDFTQTRTYRRPEDGHILKLEDLIKIIESEQQKLNFTNSDTVRNTASKCRKALHELAAFLAGKTQQRPKTLEP